MPETKERKDDKAKFSVLKHQRWWERSSKTKRNARRAKKQHDKAKLSVLEHQRWWERSSKRKETLETNTTREAQYTRTPTQVGEELNTKRNARNERKKRRQGEAQSTRTSTLVGEELKDEKKCPKRKESNTTRRSSRVLEHQLWWERSLKEGQARYLEERKIKRLNHGGQTASTYGSHTRPERN